MFRWLENLFSAKQNIEIVELIDFYKYVKNGKNKNFAFVNSH